MRHGFQPYYYWVLIDFWKHIHSFLLPHIITCDVTNLISLFSLLRIYNRLQDYGTKVWLLIVIVVWGHYKV